MPSGTDLRALQPKRTFDPPGEISALRASYLPNFGRLWLKSVPYWTRLGFPQLVCNVASPLGQRDDVAIIQALCSDLGPIQGAA